MPLLQRPDHPGIFKTCSNYILSLKGVDLLRGIAKFTKDLPTLCTKIIRGCPYTAGGYG
jgi:hypothetical protein